MTLTCSHCGEPLTLAAAVIVTVRATGKSRLVHRPTASNSCFRRNVGRRAEESVALAVPPPDGWWRDIGHVALDAARRAAELGKESAIVSRPQP
jgi:hypothetical protein